MVAKLVLLILAGLILYYVVVGIATVLASSEQITLKPYSGLGSGVLAPGTVLKEQYKDESSVAGKLNIGGVWIIEDKR